LNVAYLHLKRAIEKNSECFLCEIENELEKKYLNNYLQELVMDAKARDEIVESRGFCNDHSYKLLIEASKPAVSDGHGVALVMQSIIEQLIRDLENNHKQKLDFSRASNDKKCPACIHISNYMAMYFREAIDLLNSSYDFLELVKHSRGFCTHHFSILIRKMSSIDDRESRKKCQVMIEVEASNLKRINQELIEYIRRQSYEFSESDRTEIASVLLRSVAKIVSRRGVKTFPNEDAHMNGKESKFSIIRGKQRGN
jgi:hypothetical protein